MSNATFHNVTSTYGRVLVSSFGLIKLSVWLSLYRIWIDLPWQGLAATPVTEGLNLVLWWPQFWKEYWPKTVADQKCQKTWAKPWNQKYIYLTYWPAPMRHFLTILRHKCRILLFEYMNMIAQNIHIQLLEYDRRGCKQGHWIWGSVLHPTARRVFRLSRGA